jgi:hypothetical protein
VGNVVEKDLRHNSANMPRQDRDEELGDFSATLRVLPISALAIAIGALCAFVPLALLRLIGLFTNFFYFGRWSTAMVSPIGNHLGVYSVLVPIAGALTIGVMARYGSERIRGHGKLYPEATAPEEYGLVKRNQWIEPSYTRQIKGALAAGPEQT